MAEAKTIGISNAPLLQKLGLKPGYKLILVDVPDTYFELLEKEPADLNIAEDITEPVNFIHLFANNALDIIENLPSLKQQLKPAGMFWVSWPKRASKVKTDLTFEVIQKIARATGLVDVKICAVDGTWSAVKLMHPKKDRGKKL